MVIGGVYIPFSGGKNLYDYITETDTGQDLADQAYAATPTLYIPIHPPVQSFMLTGYRYGYVDGAATNDLANVYLLEDAEADDDALQRHAILATGSLTETPVSALGTYVEIDTPIPVYLRTAGKLYFQTDWTTGVIDCSGTEHFFFIVYGIAMETDF